MNAQGFGASESPGSGCAPYDVIIDATGMLKEAARETVGPQAKMSRISELTDDRPRWSVAVFAHDEAAHIRRSLEAIARAVDDPRDIDVWVLANGCSDTTADQVRACAPLVRNLWLAEIAIGDKANAWNVYVHDVLSHARAKEIEAHVFTDGDVTLERDAIEALAAALREVPTADGAGGMPATGRDKSGWRRRMVANGVLAGNLYALHGRVIEAVRASAIRLPVGLIGEDFLVSWLVASSFGTQPPDGDGPKTIFCPAAEFSFRSLSPLRPRDWPTYARRKWRYTMRALQLEMLTHVLRGGGMSAMPRHVDELYLHAPLPSRLRWIGVETPLRSAAVLWIRRFRRRAEEQPAR